MKETNLRTENFIIYVKKATEFICGLGFTVENTLFVLQALQISQ